jgi:hypothetical protein
MAESFKSGPLGYGCSEDQTPYLKRYWRLSMLGSLSAEPAQFGACGRAVGVSPPGLGQNCQYITN